MTRWNRLTPFDTSGLFRPAAEAGGVRLLAVRGAGATLLSGGVVLCVQIVATMVLARLLAPRDFGVVAMVTTVSLFLTNFGPNGYTEAVIQREEIDHGLASNLFWINVGTGLLLTIGFGAAGSLLAWFYRDPLVARVAVGVSVSIVLTSTSVVHLALLKRDMRFPTTSANDIVARMVSVTVSVALGWAGWGYWALVAGVIALPLSQSLGGWYLCRWVPGLPRRVAGTVSTVRFALSVYGRFSIGFFTQNLDNLLVGWRFGAGPLGFYKKAYDLFALSGSQITAPLTNVAVSALSRMKRDSVEFRQHIIGALALMAFLGMGLGADLTLIGKDVIFLLLGPKWGASGRIFTFFGPGIGVMLVYYAHGWIHLSIGRADRWLRWSIIELTVTGTLFLLGLHWGPVGIAAAWTLSFWILTVPAFWYAGKPVGIGVAPVVGAAWRYLVASLLAGCATAAIIHGIPSLGAVAGSGGALTRIALTTGLVGTFYLGGVILLHGGYSPIFQVIGLLMEIVPWGSPRPQPTGVTIPALTAVTRDEQEPAQVAGDLVYQAGDWDPLVSILIPAYNAQEWIADTLRSALAQTWRRIEIIVVDDGSTDQTLATARRFESDRVRVVTQKNQGAAAARNHAFSLSRGDYIQWLDADDLLSPDKIARQMEALKPYRSKRVLLSSPWGMFMYRHHEGEFIPTSLWCDLPPLEWLLRKMGGNVYMQTATWLVSRELTDAAGPWDPRLLSDDDGEYFCRVLLASEGVRFVPAAKVYYRGPGLAFRSLSYVGQSKRKLDALWLSMQLHIKYLRSLEESERVRAACLIYLQNWLLYFFPEMPDIVKAARELAGELGGHLTTPRLSWKYSWMKTLFGWRVAKHGQLFLLQLRWSMEKSWEKILHRIKTSGRGLTSPAIDSFENRAAAPPGTTSVRANIE
jgi:PST family polysaccharide transporter